MAAATEILGLRETLLGPDALPPPPVRHALFASLVVLAAIFHLCTAGWGEIQNGPEGEYAGGARQMLHSPDRFVPIRHGIVAPEEPPLLYWTLNVSYRVFGVTTVAARLPSAFAMIALVALTFLIGEALNGYWRAFVAGLIQLSLCGSFLWGRMVTPEPLFAVSVAGAYLCIASGYHNRRHRRWWFNGLWFCTALAYLTKGATAFFLLGAVVLLLALCFREARMRFPAMLHWSGLLIFAAVVVPWHVWLQMRFPGSLGAIASSQWLLPFMNGVDTPGAEHVRITRFLLSHLVWWYPLSLLVLPALLFSWRRTVRPHEISFSDAVPHFWMAAGLAPLLIIPHRQHVDSLPVWSAFSLWAACAWDRASLRSRIAGIALAALACVIGGVAARAATLAPVVFGWTAGDHLFATDLALAAVVAALCAFVAAAYLLWRKEETLAVGLLILGVLPLGLTIAEANARRGQHASFAALATFLPANLGTDGELLYEGSLRSASSLGFYIRRRFFVIDAPSASSTERVSPEHRLTRESALEKLGAPHPVYLLLHKDRVPWWQEQLTTRYHLYHQVGTYGDYVLVNNQP